MEIESLIDHSYYAVSALEDMSQVAEWLLDRDYYAIIDDDYRITGIVTASDTLLNYEHQVVNCHTYKPVLAPRTSILEAYNLMKRNKQQALPVFNDNEFIGVITLWAIVEVLFNTLQSFDALQQTTINTAP